jgi:hypothetical protein
MKTLTCNDCRTHLTGYIQGDLPLRLRLRVGAHLDDCAGCYGVYMREREMARDLTAQVPMIGRADGARLGKIWSAVQTEMIRPRRSSLSRIPKRYGIATAVLVVALLLPSLGFQALQHRQMLMALPVPPTPTETIERTSQAVAMATAVCSCTPASEATTSPEFTLPAQPNYAPDVSGTAAP